MNHSLENIFKAITPESIKNIPVIQDAMKIFVEVLEEKSKVSIDIKNVLNENSPQVIQDELVKIYLNDIYRVLNGVQHNKIIAEKIDRYNQAYGAEYIKKDVLGTLSSVLNGEHYFTTKEYKQKKGTVHGIKYIYDMIENIITTGEEKSDILIIEKEPFNLKIEGSMLKELYDSIVRPLSHPLGFIYTYVNIIKLYLEDSFNLIYHYYNSTVEVRCLSGNVDSYSHKKIIDIREEIITKRRVLKISFEDGSRLEQWIEPIVVKYFENDILVKQYPEEGHCSIFLEYDFELELATKDEITFRDSNFLNDDYFDEEGQCDLIGGPDFIVGQVILGNHIVIDDSIDDIIIGKFVIGRKRRNIKEIVTYRETQNIISSINITNTIEEDFDINVQTMLSDNIVINDSLNFDTEFKLDVSYNIVNSTTDEIGLFNLESLDTTDNYDKIIQDSTDILEVKTLSDNIETNLILDTFETQNISEYSDIVEINLLTDSFETQNISEYVDTVGTNLILDSFETQNISEYSEVITVSDNIEVTDTPLSEDLFTNVNDNIIMSESLSLIDYIYINDNMEVSDTPISEDLFTTVTDTMDISDGVALRDIINISDIVDMRDGLSLIDIITINDDIIVETIIV